jgi:hypothetical protein
VVQTTALDSSKVSDKRRASAIDLAAMIFIDRNVGELPLEWSVEKSAFKARCRFPLGRGFGPRKPARRS